MRTFIALLGSLAACGSSGASEPGVPDATIASIDATPTPDAACPESARNTYYRDFDEDSFGDPDFIAVDCEIPMGFVENSLDCNDRNLYVNPDGTELCDGMDTDCDPETIESCPDDCVPYDREGVVYLFCDRREDYDDAEPICESQGMHLVRIDDTVEQAWLASQRAVAFGAFALTWIGGNDRDPEGSWVWADGEMFWMGGPGGMPVGGLFSFWRGSEPNNNDASGQDCAALSENGSGGWVDRRCNDDYRFICEQL